MGLRVLFACAFMDCWGEDLQGGGSKKDVMVLEGQTENRTEQLRFKLCDWSEPHQSF